MSSVDRDAIQTYEEEGVVCLRGMFDQETIAGAYEAATRYMQNPNGANPHREIGAEKAADAPGRFFMASVSRSRGDDVDFQKMAFDPRCAEIAARLMGVEDVRYFYSQLFVKDPLTAAPTQWHQDMPFWPFEGEHIVSLWIALLPVSKESSGVEYVAGSHRWGKFHRATTPDEDPSRADPTLEPCPNYDEANYRADPSLRFRSWALEPGDVVCHHPLTIHGASGNSSPTQRRAGLSIRYFGNDVRWKPRTYGAKFPMSPDIRAGDYPADDDAFPVIPRLAQPVHP